MHSTTFLRATFAAAVLSAAPLVFAQNNTFALPLGPTVSEWALESYVQTALVRMQTSRWEVDAAVRALPPGDERYAPAYNLIQRGELLIHRLRSAHPGEVITLQAEFERTHAELAKFLGHDRET